MSDQTNTTQALLVSLSFRLPRQSILLKKEAHDIEQAAKAQSGTVKATLSYFQKAITSSKTEDALAGIKSYQNAWRAEHNRLTRVWDGNNTRLLPATLISQYMEMTEKFKAGFPKEVAEFLAAYPEWAASAPERMGDLYAKANFPSLKEVTNSISHDLSYIPLPAGDAFKRIAVISHDTALIMEQVTNEKVQSAIKDAQAQTWKDIMEPIRHLVTTLNKDKTKIYDSLIGNITSVVDLIPQFNAMFHDEELAQLAASAKENLSTIDLNEVKKDPKAKAAAIEKAQQVLDAFEPFACSFNV